MSILNYISDIEKEPVEIRMSRAAASDTPPYMLRQLSKDSFWYIRDLVASNAKTPRDCLEELAKEKDFRIRNDALKTIAALDRHIPRYKTSLQSQINQA